MYKIDSEGHTYRVLSDHLGSVRMLVDDMTGEVTQRIDYDPWGKVLADTNPGAQPFGFAGGLYDTDTGLVRFGARDYDPQTGRWTNKDPIGFAGGDVNLYGYVVGNPISLFDLNGMDFWLSLANWLDHSGVSSFAAGFGDTLSFGASRYARDKLGIDGGVDPCSNAYMAGEITGEVYNVLSTVSTIGTILNYGKLPLQAIYGSWFNMVAFAPEATQITWDISYGVGLNTYAAVSSLNKY